jgi:hypothetical protein
MFYLFYYIFIWIPDDFFYLKVFEAGRGQQFMRILCLRQYSHSCRSIQDIYFLGSGSK